MQYLVSVIDDDDRLRPPRPRMAAIDVFNDRLRAEGHWVFAGGLGVARHRPPSSTTGVTRRCSPTGPSWSRRSTSPASGSSRPPDLDVALKLAAEGSKACNRKVEVRPFL